MPSPGWRARPPRKTASPACPSTWLCWSRCTTPSSTCFSRVTLREQWRDALLSSPLSPSILCLHFLFLCTRGHRSSVVAPPSSGFFQARWNETGQVRASSGWNMMDAGRKWEPYLDKWTCCGVGRHTNQHAHSQTHSPSNWHLTTQTAPAVSPALCPASDGGLCGCVCSLSSPVKVHFCGEPSNNQHQRHERPSSHAAPWWMHLKHRDFKMHCLSSPPLTVCLNCTSKGRGVVLAHSRVQAGVYLIMALFKSPSKVFHMETRWKMASGLGRSVVYNVRRTFAKKWDLFFTI